MPRLAFAILAFLAACSHTRQREAVDALARSVPVSAFEEGSFGNVLPYRLLRPAEVRAGELYPLVVIFHGSGAIGTNNVDQLGPFAKSWATPAMRARHPAFVLVPHFATRSAVYTPEGSHPTDSLRNALRGIDELQRTLPIDPHRIYAAGFSMGGSAVWNAIALRPGLFSAAVIVAGVPNRDALAVLGQTRLLLIHGDADTENPYAAARAAYEAAPKDRVAFWRYRGLGHEFPLELITSTKLADWLFR
jgi:predicted peptidase